MALRGSLTILGAGFAGAALLLVVARRDGGASTQIETLGSDFEAQVREAAAAAQARAVTLAELPRLAWAVATDEATVRNLTGEELAFHPQPKETIEIGQVIRRSSQVMTLLRSPTGTKVRAPLNSPGLHLVVVGDELQLTAVVSIDPKVHADLLRGVVAVSRQVDLSRLEKRISDLGLALHYECAAGNLLAIGTAATGRTRSIAMSLTSEAARAGKLWVIAPELSSERELLTGAAALVLLGAIVWAGLVFRRPRPLAMASDAALAPPGAPWRPAVAGNPVASAWRRAPTPISSVSVASPDDDLPLTELVPESRNEPVPPSVMRRLTPSLGASAPPRRPIRGKDKP